jgi:hypothetical protein
MQSQGRRPTGVYMVAFNSLSLYADWSSVVSENEFLFSAPSVLNVEFVLVCIGSASWYTWVAENTQTDRSVTKRNKTEQKTNRNGLKAKELRYKNR